MTIRICTVHDCNNKHYGLGFCKKHLWRFKKYGHVGLTNREKGTGSISNYHIIKKKGISKRQHVWVAEEALGKPLPSRAEVHHVDGNKLNNTPTNLVICPSDTYHMLIEQRTRSYEACGHADWLKCWVCKKWDDQSNLFVKKSGRGFHRDCQNSYYRDLRKMKKIQFGGTI